MNKENDSCNCKEKNCACNNEQKKKDKKQLHDKELKNKIETLEKENQELNDKVLRLSAEIQNMAKRQSEALSYASKYEGFDLIKNLLPIVDNFERSIAMDKSVNEKYLEGYKMIYTNMINTLTSIGVEEIICQDKEFDPQTMEALMTEHVDGVEPNYVLLVLQKGYKYKDRILRPAMVKVSI